MSWTSPGWAPPPTPPTLRRCGSWSGWGSSGRGRSDPPSTTTPRGTMWPFSGSPGKSGRHGRGQREPDPGPPVGDRLEGGELEPPGLGGGSQVGPPAGAPVRGLDLHHPDRVHVGGQRDQAAAGSRVPVVLSARQMADPDREVPVELGPQVRPDVRELLRAGERGRLEVEDPRAPLEPGADGPAALALEQPRAQQVLGGVEAHVPVPAVPVEDPLDLLADRRSGRPPVASQAVEDRLAALGDVRDRELGPRAERFNPNQLLLFPDGTTPSDEGTLPALAATPPEPTPRTPRPGHGRQPLPKHLPRDRRVYELTAAERACPCCGQERVVIGAETSEQLDYEPAIVKVIEHVRWTYACTHCQAPRATVDAGAPASLPGDVSAGNPAERVSAAVVPEVTPPPTDRAPVRTSTFTTAPKPLSPWPRCLAAPGLLAYVIVSKYSDHLPLYRLEHILGRSGVALRRSTLCDWLADSATLLRPLYQIMVQEVLQSWVIQTDDTPVPVQDKDRDRTRQGHVWDYWGDVYHPYVVYDYTPNHEQVGPRCFLANYLGYLQADAYTGYDALFATGRVVEVSCWAHARRKFYEAQATDPERALYVLGVIRQLYQIEKQVDDAIEARRLPREVGWWCRLQARHEQALPVLTTLAVWLTSQREQVLPKSPIGEAIGYAMNQWAALVRYTTQGYLAIDNNAAERALRPIAIGRKNYLFFGSDVGGATAAVLYSFVQSCKRLGIEPWRYLRDVLEQLPRCPAERLPELLPDRWAQVQAAQARAAPPDH